VFKKNLYKIAVIIIALLLNACSRMIVVPDDDNRNNDYNGGYNQDRNIVENIENVEIVDAIISPNTPTYIPKPSVIRKNTYHTVKSSETLYSIAQKYNVNYRELAAWNNIAAPTYNINSGQRLTLIANANSPISIPNFYTPGTRFQHIVRVAETLYSIAQLYGFSVSDLMNWNNFWTPDKLQVGQKLLMKVTPRTKKVMRMMRLMSTQKTRVYTRNSHYLVRRGDTLYSIARRYGCTVKQISNWNNIRRPYRLKIGQSLTIRK
jgi:LysM repeat protein